MVELGTAILDFYPHAEGYREVKNYAWGQVTLKDYIVPYWLPSWIKPAQIKIMTQATTSYRVNKMGFKIDNITCGEYATKNND